MAKKKEDTEAEFSGPPGLSKYAKDASKPIKVIVFKAAWCGACTALAKAKTLEKLVQAYPADAELITIDVDKDEETADEYEVQSMPAIFFEDKEGWILEEQSGSADYATFEKLFLKAKIKLKDGAR